MTHVGLVDGLHHLSDHLWAGFFARLLVELFDLKHGEPIDQQQEIIGDSYGDDKRTFPIFSLSSRMSERRGRHGFSPIARMADPNAAYEASRTSASESPVCYKWEIFVTRSTFDSQPQ